MTNEELKQLQELIKSNETLTDQDKETFVQSLAIFNEYNVDLNKIPSLIKLMRDNKDFLNDDSVNREDALLKYYHLPLDASFEEIEDVRDSILFDLSVKIKETKYLDKARRLRERSNRIRTDFEYIVDHYDKRSLPGEMNQENLRRKANVTGEYARLLDSLLEFAVDKNEDNTIVDKKESDLNYAYEGMSDDEIAKAKANIGEHQPMYFSYDEDVHDYLEPIEYFPNTNIKKPRNRGAFESVEHYNAFLENYYAKYNFEKAKDRSIEQPDEFYADKLDYTKNKFQVFFGYVKDALADLRWLYNHAINDGKDDELLTKFANEYEAKVDSINAINTKLFNEQSLRGDVVLDVELVKESDTVNSNVFVYMSLIDEENRRKYANYVVNRDTGRREVDEDYQFELDKITNKDLDEMVDDFVDSAIDNIEGYDKESVLSSNVDLIIDGKHYVMPLADFGLNSIKILQLGPSAYVKRSSYKKELVKQPVNNDLVNNSINNDDVVSQKINETVRMTGTIGEGMPTPEQQFENETGEQFDPEKHEVRYDGAEVTEEESVTPFTVVEKEVEDNTVENTLDTEVVVPTVNEEVEEFEPIPDEVVDQMLNNIEDNNNELTEENITSLEQSTEPIVEDVIDNQVPFNNFADYYNEQNINDESITDKAEENNTIDNVEVEDNTVENTEDKNVSNEVVEDNVEKDINNTEVNESDNIPVVEENNDKSLENNQVNFVLYDEKDDSFYPYQEEETEENDLIEDDELDKMLQDTIDNLPKEEDVQREHKELYDELSAEQNLENNQQNYVYPPIMPVGIEDKQEKVELIEQKDDSDDDLIEEITIEEDVDDVELDQSEPSNDNVQEEPLIIKEDVQTEEPEVNNTENQVVQPLFNDLNQDDFEDVITVDFDKETNDRIAKDESSTQVNSAPVNNEPENKPSYNEDSIFTPDLLFDDSQDYSQDYYTEPEPQVQHEQYEPLRYAEPENDVQQETEYPEPEVHVYQETEEELNNKDRLSSDYFTEDEYVAPSYETFEEYYNDKEHQQQLLNTYRIVSKRKPDHSKKTIAITVLGAVGAIMGVVASSGIGAILSAGGAVALNSVINRKNIYRLAQKHKLKKIANHNGAKCFFGRNGRVEMRSLDGFYLTDDQIEAIQNELDDKINSKLDPEYVPRVTIKNLENAFTIDYDEETVFVSNNYDDYEYRKMRERESNLFDEVDGDNEYYMSEDDIEKYLSGNYKEIDIAPREQANQLNNNNNEEDVKVVNESAYTDEYLKELAASKRAAKAAIEDILYLNPSLENTFKEDDEGYYISLEDPASVILPEGFEYDPIDGFNNMGDKSQVAVSIKVIVPIKGYHDVVKEAIEKYGDLLKRDDDVLEQILKNDSTYTFDTLVAARDRLKEKSL